MMQIIYSRFNNLSHVLHACFLLTAIDTLVLDNTSGRSSNIPNRSAGRKWLQLALKHRNLKLKQRPVDIRGGDGNRRKTVTGSSEGRDRVTQSFHRRRIDVNLIESREN